MLESRIVLFDRERVRAEPDVRRHMEGEMTMHEPRARSVGHPGRLHRRSGGHVLRRHNALRIRAHDGVAPRPATGHHAEEGAVQVHRMRVTRRVEHAVVRGISHGTLEASGERPGPPIQDEDLAGVRESAGRVTRVVGTRDHEDIVTPAGPGRVDDDRAREMSVLHTPIAQRAPGEGAEVEAIPHLLSDRPNGTTVAGGEYERVPRIGGEPS